jgi:tRNA-splicing ligase RtcB
MTEINLKKINSVEWEIPVGTIPNMNVPGRVFASEKLLEKIRMDRSLLQCANVATLPGIYKYSIALPDMHEGYGFPIGGVAALDFKEGGISPGGIGYDINCGVRLMRTGLQRKEAEHNIKPILEALFRNVPSGLGSKGKTRVGTHGEFDEVLKLGARWAVERGF